MIFGATPARAAPLVYFPAPAVMPGGCLPHNAASRIKATPDILAMLASFLQLRVAPVSSLTLCPPTLGGAKGVIDTPCFNSKEDAIAQR